MYGQPINIISEYSGVWDPASLGMRTTRAFESHYSEILVIQTSTWLELGNANMYQQVSNDHGLVAHLVEREPEELRVGSSSLFESTILGQ